MAKKERLDVLLVTRGLFPTREKARRAIMAGLVRVEGDRVDKAGEKVPLDARIEVKGDPCPYVSRGGLKLERALRVFGLDLTDKAVLDVGASTGGFTDCALQHGARRVYAVDVGYGQLDWKLRQDPRVVVMERTNFRYAEPSWFPEPPDVATVDVSFISLVAITVGIFMPLIMTFRIFRPLRIIKEATEDIAQGRFSKIEVLDTRDEMQQVMEAFNIMVKELERRQDQLVQSQKLSSIGTLTAGIA
ncbi:MAG: TlyA family rRNA (cytidine-2'-O)-methyltransferase, partial [Calditerricola sp.]|nr:TlyA family rRNA (cytidine-2'-O)-methyltransferase [Calditerricola sp.]